MQLSDITVRTFMKCLFNKDFEGVGEENWERLYTEYIDLSGMGEEGQLGLYVGIHNLTVRLKFITDYLEFQSKVFHLVGMPHLEKLPYIHKFGHRPKWNPQEPEKFLIELQKIETKEKRNYVELKMLEKELEDMQKIQKPQTVNARNSFVVMLNVLNKDGYKIDRDKTDMEELALMIKQHGEDIKAINQNQ